MYRTCPPHAQIFSEKTLDIFVTCTYNVIVEGGDTVAPKEKANTERVSTFLSEKHLEELREEAERKGTNVSALIRMIVLEHLSEKK